MEQDLAASLPELFIQNQLQPLCRKRRDRAGILLRVGNMTGGPSARLERVYQLLHDAADDLLFTGVKGHHRSDAARRQTSAQIAVLLDDQNARAAARRRDRRSAAGHASAADHNIKFPIIDCSRHKAPPSLASVVFSSITVRLNDFENNFHIFEKNTKFIA